MYIRCAQCRASTWIEVLSPEGESQTLGCGGCGRTYTVTVPGELGGDARARYRSALAFAEQRDLDLPSAYSVLLGVMTPEQARGLDGPAVPRSDSGRSPAPAKPTRLRVPMVELDYDPGFADAVADGYLSAKQARERGDRQVLARQLMRRHDLPPMLAYLVADNKISVAVALQRVRQEKLDAERRAGRGVSWTRRRIAWAAGLATPLLLAALLSAIVVRDRGASTPLNATRSPARATGPTGGSDRSDRGPSRAGTSSSEVPTDVVRDPAGRLTRVAGRTPDEVLVSFCRQYDEGGQIEPISIATTIPPSPSTRLGIYRDFRELDFMFAIRIRRDRDARRWTAGDGERPIVPLRDPHLPPEESHRPIATR